MDLEPAAGLAALEAITLPGCLEDVLGGTHMDWQVRATSLPLACSGILTTGAAWPPACCCSCPSPTICGMLVLEWPPERWLP